MIKVNWDLFKVKNENYRQAFEDLCFHLFCRKVNVVDSIKADFNQIGLETEPVKHNSKYWGFQAKFFDSSIDYQQIKKSVELALSRYQNLDTIIIYTNKQPTSSSKGCKAIDDAAKKADKTIEWIAPRDFDLLLTRPGNHDLGRLYFNFSNEYGFITDIKKNSLIQSNSYIELSFEDEHNEKVEELSQKLLASTNKITLISGAPGSGKSVFMYKLFFDYAGLEASNKEEMQQVLVKNGAFPILIDLKECNYQPLELIARNILKDYNLESQKIIYLLDGLDELSDNALHNVLNHIDRLVHFVNTSKIIVSSRINSFNRTKFKSIFSDCLEYHIAPLTMNEISTYFESKQDECKIELLKKVQDVFLKEIQEIVLLSLLWENIEQLTEQSSIIDLFDLHINHILDNSRHCKVLNTLNLPSPPKDAIIKINKEIAQAMYINKSLEIGYETLHSLIEKMFPRCSYKDINEIANYISDCFFDNISSNVNNSQFTYIHRRYQEYFLVLKIKELFEIAPKVIRDFRIAGNRDLFQGIFLKHIYQDYTKKQNIRGILDYSILKLYLGLSDSWGADEAYHRNSSPFLPALLSQNDDVFESLLKDPNIDFDANFIIDIEDIRKNIDVWKKHQDRGKRHFKSDEYLRDIWGHHIPRVISQTSVLHKYGKYNLAESLYRHLKDVVRLYDECEVHETMSRLNMPLDDPFWDVLDDYFYARIVVGKKRINKTLLKRVIAESKHYNDRAYMPREISPQDTYLEAFVKVALFYRAKEFLKLIDDASEDIMIPLIRNASRIEYIHLVLNDENILDKCASFLASYTYKITGQTLFIPFAEKSLGLNISEEEILFVEEQAKELRNERPFFWESRDGVHKYTLLSLATPSKFSYKEILIRLKENFIGCTELDLCVLLYRDYILMLKKQKHIDAIVRDYVNIYMPLLRLGMRYQSGRHLIKAEAGIWAKIFKYAGSDIPSLYKLKTIISNVPDNGINTIDFLLALKGIDEYIYNRIISERLLDEQSEGLDDWHTDFSSYVDRAFELSYLYSNINADKSLSCIFEGINQGTLRHGWRKDTLVCYELTEALEVMLENNFISCHDSRNTIQEVFNLTVKARDITDGKYTWKGPYEVIRIVSNYDVDLAAELYSQYANKNEMANIAKLFLVKAKIGLGYSADDIFKEIGRFTQRSYVDTIDKDYYEQCFAAYIYLAAKELYSNRHRRQAFNRARSCIEALNDNSSYFRGNDFDDEIKKYEELCLKYNVESNIRQAKDDDVKPEEKLSEADFVVKLNRIKSSSGLENIFKILFNRNIDITKKETWELLINKTESIDSSIDRMLAYFKHLYYPSASYWSSNSHSAYYALAALLRKPDYQSELFNYLKDHCGHDSYSELIKAYSANNDKKNSILLFDRFIKICHLLVD